MKKILILIYGILAYLIFLISFLYAIGFVGSYFVPKSINDGASTSFMYALVVNLLLLSLFAIQHGIMARPAYKKWISPVIGPAIERSTFVLFASLILLLLFWKWQPMTANVWNFQNDLIQYFFIGLSLFGWLVVLVSTFLIDHLELVGLKQVYNNLTNKQTANPKFITRFLYKVSRHPMMLGFIIAFWSTPHMTVGHLLFAIVTTLYIFIAVKYLEEKDLRKDIGQPYEEYQKNVPMIIPFTKNKKK
jgi:protein-S-isoprenylcysteine O-methyltransferase Ste14